jgi:predicted Zn-dependent protease
MNDAWLELHVWDPLAESFREALREQLSDRLGLDVRWGEELVDTGLAYNEERAQYLATSYLDMMSKLFKEGNELHLGLTTRDLYLPGQSFVLGDEDPNMQVAIVSLARLDPKSYGENPNPHGLLAHAFLECVCRIERLLGAREELCDLESRE